MDPRREMPRLADKSFRRQWGERGPAVGSSGPAGSPDNTRDPMRHRRIAEGSVTDVDASHRVDDGFAVDGAGPGVMLWIDSFTDAFAPEIAWAAVELIESLGHRVTIPERRVCCGLTWISTGQLDGARKRLRGTLAALDAHVRAGGVVVGLEPSCTAALRSDLPELLPDDPRAESTARAVRTLAEFLTGDPAWRAPDRAGRTVVVQPHCHQHAIMGHDADRAILEQTGARVTEIAGCCGLAGNFGMQSGHYDISVAVAENGLLPALRRPLGPSSSPTVSPAAHRRPSSAAARAATLAQFLLEG